MTLRYERLDALRALALLWMVAFHFCFDLNYFGFIQQNFYQNPFWIWQRNAIVALFVFCAGIGLAIGLEQQQSWQRFARRQAQLWSCALLVSLGSWLMFPHSYISFGVLHGIAMMLLLSRLCTNARHWLWPMGLFALLLPQWLAHSWFDSRLTNWIGLVTHKPPTEDFVPLLPWLGAMWWGLAAGQWLLRKKPHWLSAELPAGYAILTRLGRNSLPFYLLHQPALIGLLFAVKILIGNGG